MLNSHGMPQQILRLSKLQLEFEAAFYDETANRSDSETTKRIGENIMNILRESNRQSSKSDQLIGNISRVDCLLHSLTPIII